MTKTMVMTVLEATVPVEQHEALQRMFSDGAHHLPSQMVRNYLVRSADDPLLWRGVSVWRSREALEEYRSAVDVPGGVLMFRAAGAEPSLTIFEIVAAGTNE